MTYDSALKLRGSNNLYKILEEPLFKNKSYMTCLFKCFLGFFLVFYNVDIFKLCLILFFVSLFFALYFRFEQYGNIESNGLCGLAPNVLGTF